MWWEEVVFHIARGIKKFLAANLFYAVIVFYLVSFKAIYKGENIMQVHTGSYMGQLVPAPRQESILSLDHAREIKQAIDTKGGIRDRHVEVFVTSGNEMKIAAARNSVIHWIQDLFKEKITGVHVNKYAVSSNIDEQPHSQNDTLSGAQNRLKNMKIELLMNSVSQQINDGTLRVLISLENGIMLETVNPLNNPDMFLTESGQVWVDRCIASVEIWFGGRSWDFNNMSEGVTNPKLEVEQSKNTQWRQTVGLILHDKYGWKANDFHGDLAGKGREIIMQENLDAGFGLPYKDKV